MTGERSSGDSGTPLLSVRNLAVHYPITKGWLRREVGRVRAVDGLSFDVDRGEALGLVGESGSGKTTVAHTLCRLEEPTDGEIRFRGQPIADQSTAERRSFTRRVGLVVQDPHEAFNPRMTVGEAVAEPLVVHGFDDQGRREAIVADLFERVGLSTTDTDRFPHEFSGGELQRIAIARALITNPDLIVADEPTSALDARVRADILDLLDGIRREHDIAVVFISHDLDVVRRFCDRVAVMYLGEIVETGRTERVLSEPKHPYTRVLLSAVPALDPRERTHERPLTDVIPDPADPPSGCRFHTRCPAVIPDPDVTILPEAWRSLVRFRFTVEVGEIPPELAVDSDEPIAHDLVRRTFDLPERLEDETLQAAVDGAVAALAAGDEREAVERLKAVLTTPCERREPAVETVDGGTVRCLRYESDIDASPPGR